ncbi:MAG: ABC transporter ATP-binding protein [Actinomycetota bacterium]
MPALATGRRSTGPEWDGTALRVEGVSFSYPKVEVLRGVSFTLWPGEVCSVLGNNGAGKSTLLKCLLRMLRPREGIILVEGIPLSRIGPTELAMRAGYVPQRSDGYHRLTVFDAVLLGRKPHVRWGVKPADLEAVEEVLHRLGLAHLALRYTDELSGGEMQKVVIARALAQEPRILLLDEPTNNLDLRNQTEVMEILRAEARSGGICVLVAIHDLNLALRYSDRFIVLKDGAVLRWGGPEVINPETIREAYGVEARVERFGDHVLVIPEGCCRFEQDRPS